MLKHCKTVTSEEVNVTKNVSISEGLNKYVLISVTSVMTGLIFNEIYGRSTKAFMVGFRLHTFDACIQGVIQPVAENSFRNFGFFSKKSHSEK